jgi:hypothetical protein
MRRSPAQNPPSVSKVKAVIPQTKILRSVTPPLRILLNLPHYSSNSFNKLSHQSPHPPRLANNPPTLHYYLPYNTTIPFLLEIVQHNSMSG